MSPLKIAKGIRFVVNLIKKCDPCDECDEKKFKRQNAIKNNFSGLPAECGEKNFSPLKSQTLQIITANFKACLKCTGNL